MTTEKPSVTHKLQEPLLSNLKAMEDIVKGHEQELTKLNRFVDKVLKIYDEKAKAVIRKRDDASVALWDELHNYYPEAIASQVIFDLNIGELHFFSETDPTNLINFIKKMEEDRE